MKNSRRTLIKSSIITALGLAIKPSFVKSNTVYVKQKKVDLTRFSIRKLSDLIHKKEISSFELVTA